MLSEGQWALDLALNRLFDKPKTTGAMLYNDEMPADAKRSDSGRFGHPKSVLAFGTASKTALWPLHSWPRFADPKSSEMPTSTPDLTQKIDPSAPTMVVQKRPGESQRRRARGKLRSAVWRRGSESPPRERKQIIRTPRTGIEHVDYHLLRPLHL